MNLLMLVWTTILSSFSTMVIMYVALATPVGPWVGPTLGLLSLVFFAHISSQRQIFLSISGGALGGIIATALSFTFPTFYFLDKTGFMQMVHNPFQFFTTVILLVVSAGMFGLLCARCLRHSYIQKQQLAFPIGQLVYRLVVAEKQVEKLYQLAFGSVASFMYALLQYPLFGNAIPRSLVFWYKTKLFFFTLPTLSIEMSLVPMFVSIGFLVGTSITLPLLVGTTTRFLFLEPLCMQFLPSLVLKDAIFAFCSGIVVSGALLSVVKLLTTALKMQKRTQKKAWFFPLVNMLKKNSTIDILLPVGIVAGLLLSFKFSIITILYLLGATSIAVYQLTGIAGKIGLALLGRFATFVMLPALFLFNLSALQITVVATFVSIAAGVATEALFGYKTAELAGIDHKKVYEYQWFGLFISAVAAAFVFYFLVIHFQLGSEQLFAQRAQARALLLQVKSFDYYVLSAGVLFGWFLKQIKLSPMLVLGGLLMPLSLVATLSLGGILSLLVKDKQVYEPLCSGLFATNALMVFLSVFF